MRCVAQAHFPYDGPKGHPPVEAETQLIAELVEFPNQSRVVLSDGDASIALISEDSIQAVG